MAFNSLCLFSKSSLVDRSLLIWPEFHHPILQKALHSDGYLLGLKRADEGPFESDVWLSAASPALSPFSPVFPTSIFGPGALGARLETCAVIVALRYRDPLSAVALALPLIRRIPIPA